MYIKLLAVYVSFLKIPLSSNLHKERYWARKLRTWGRCWRVIVFLVSVYESWVYLKISWLVQKIINSNTHAHRSFMHSRHLSERREQNELETRQISRGCICNRFKEFIDGKVFIFDQRFRSLSHIFPSLICSLWWKWNCNKSNDYKHLDILRL